MTEKEEQKIKSASSLLDLIPWSEIVEKTKNNFRIPINEEAIKEAVKEFKVLNEPEIALCLEHQEEYCERCGNCCRHCSPIAIYKPQLKKISKFLKLPYKKLKKKYHIKPSGSAGILHLRGKPCPFLQGKNNCTIYSVRPLACRLYPFGKPASELHEIGGLQLIEDCPAVKNLMIFLLSAKIMFKMATQAGVLPENPDPEFIQGLLNELGIKKPKTIDDVFKKKIS